MPSDKILRVEIAVDYELRLLVEKVKYENKLLKKQNSELTKSLTEQHQKNIQRKITQDAFEAMEERDIETYKNDAKIIALHYRKYHSGESRIMDIICNTVLEEPQEE